MNIKALKCILPDLDVEAVEINEKATESLKMILEEDKIYTNSIFEFKPPYEYDLVLTKGVLIHLNPDKIEEAYNVLFNSMKKYLIIAEYYNPTPVEVPYRGNNGYLFKRDFAGEFLELYKDTTALIDYGFVYHRDKIFPQDDITWFLIEKIKK